MGHLAAASIKGQSCVHDLQVILRATLSLLKDHTPYITEDGSLRNLELALVCAITDLERVELQESAVRSTPHADP